MKSQKRGCIGRRVCFNRVYGHVVFYVAYHASYTGHIGEILRIDEIRSASIYQAYMEIIGRIKTIC